MNKNQQLIQLRTRKLGVLILDSRRAAHRTAEECASAIGIDLEKFMAFENGEFAPSLPELEVLAFELDIPLEHFWGNLALSQVEKTESLKDREHLRSLRDKMIGAAIRMGRIKMNITNGELEQLTSIPEDTLAAYEMGQQSIPLPELEIIARSLDVPIERFFDQKGPIGSWRSQQESVQKFTSMPPEVQEFICKPVNLPYLQLAMRLSELSVDKLRGIAESLLEITF